MPTVPHRLDAMSTRREAHAPRTARLAIVLLVLMSVATAAAQTCASSWADYQVWRADGTTATPWNDAASYYHHTRHHGEDMNQRLAGAQDYFDYYEAFMLVVQITFGYEYSYLAEQMGLKTAEEAWLAVGLSGLDAFVNFDDPIEIGSDESGTYCANLYSIKDGTHAGEFLLIVRDAETDQIRHWEVAPTEDVGRGRAHEVMKGLDKVMLDPDGCGDMRVGEGC